MNIQKAIAILAEELKVANKILKQRDLEPGVAEIGRDKVAAYEAGIHALSTMQKEESEEIVYCKDCMYIRRSHDKRWTFCGIHSSMPGPFEVFEKDFCSRGIRRGGTP